MNKTEAITTEELADAILEGIPDVTEDFRTMTNIVLNKIFEETNSYYGKKQKGGKING